MTFPRAAVLSFALSLSLGIQARRLQDESSSAAQPPTPFVWRPDAPAAAAPRTGDLLLRLAEALLAVNTSTLPCPPLSGDGAPSPGREKRAASAAMAAAATAAAAAAAASGSGSVDGGEREGEDAPMEDLVVAPAVLAAVREEEIIWVKSGGHRADDGGVEGDSAAERETGGVIALDGVEQHLDHVLEGLVRVRGLVMPRSRCGVSVWQIVAFILFLPVCGLFFFTTHEYGCF